MTKLIVLFALVLAGCASTTPEERAKREFEREMLERDARSVRITRNQDAVRGCQSLGTVSDDDFKDLQKKAAKMGGNTAFIMMQSPHTKMGVLSPVIVQVVTAEVYHCPR